jgi:hypothetical protein
MSSKPTFLTLLPLSLMSGPALQLLLLLVDSRRGGARAGEAREERARAAELRPAVDLAPLQPVAEPAHDGGACAPATGDGARARLAELGPTRICATVAGSGSHTRRRSSCNRGRQWRPRLCFELWRADSRSERLTMEGSGPRQRGEDRGEGATNVRGEGAAAEKWPTLEGSGPRRRSYQSHGRAAPRELLEPWSHPLRAGLASIAAAGQGREEARPVELHVVEGRGEAGHAMHGSGGGARLPEHI